MRAAHYCLPVLCALLSAPALAAPPSLKLQDLTWTEVRDALADGYDTVLIPTGGTEQNGPYLVLGKHAYIVGHAADGIAKALGNTLVAPVVVYTPEGDVDAEDGHMRFPGTVTIPEDVFADLLEATARSFKRHGFRRIVFLGDSYENQEPQREVAETLSDEWEDEGVLVLHAGDYYADNGQDAYLNAKGFDATAIGSHAGLADTAELMAAHPEGVRTPIAKRARMDTYVTDGIIGAPELASKELGQALLKLKIAAAVRQIRAEKHP